MSKLECVKVAQRPLTYGSGVCCGSRCTMDIDQLQFNSTLPFTSTRSSCQSSVRLIVTTAAIALTSAVSAAALIVIVVSQVQPLSAVGLLVVIVMLFMTSFPVVLARMTSTTIRIVTSSVATGAVPALLLTITSTGRVSVTRRVGVARRVSFLRRLIRGLVSRTMAGGVMRTVVVVPLGTITSSRAAIAWLTLANVAKSKITASHHC